jgi:NADPH-dependent glutamate synthase beta subunit-like oxidoreductase
MKLEDSTAYTQRCFHGEPASCSYACPFRLDIRAFLEKAGKGRWLPAYKALRNAVVFPVIVSALCDQPCRAHCQRTLLGDEAIAIRDLEAACIRYTKNHKPESYVIPPKNQRIVVVGAGVSGLACALNLAQKKFLVTVFEKESGWGGALRTHPRFAEFDEDIALQFSTVKTEFRYGIEIKSLDELSEFDAVYRNGSRRQFLRTSPELGRRPSDDVDAQDVYGRRALRSHSYGRNCAGYESIYIH